MRVLVTGGAGFIGSNLVRKLLETGYDVSVLDNFATGHSANLDGADVKLVEGDIRSYERVAAATKDVELVFHQAALPSVPRSVQDPITTNEVNVSGTLNVLLAARDRGVRRVIAASSSSVYGDTPGMPRIESQRPQPLSPYAVSKLAAEHYCRAAHRVYSLETVVLRYFNVFGERQDPLSAYAAVIPKFIRQLLRGEGITIFGDGSTSRDFTHVDNVIAANVAAATAPHAVGRVINVAMGESHTLNSLATCLSDLLEVQLAPTYAPARAGDVHESIADIALARELLDYEPRVPFVTGARRTIEWLAHWPQHEDRNPLSRGAATNASAR